MVLCCAPAGCRGRDSRCVSGSPCYGFLGTGSESGSGWLDSGEIGKAVRLITPHDSFVSAHCYQEEPCHLLPDSGVLTPDLGGPAF